MRYISIYSLLLLVSFTASSKPIDEQFNSASADITAILEVVNTLGKLCDNQLNTLGYDGAKTNQCSQYLKSHQQGGALQDIVQHCLIVADWYASKQILIRTNPNYTTERPTEAAELLKNMKWARGVCPPRNPPNYKFVNKPMKKIELLSPK